MNDVYAVHEDFNAVLRWKSPDEGVIKINSDGAFKDQCWISGIRVVIIRSGKMISDTIINTKRHDNLRI